MKKFQVLIDGAETEVLAEKIAGRLWIHMNGRTFDYLPASEDGGLAGQETDLDPTKIVAPMPGKIMKIRHSVGDTVEVGDTVVAMEAMKMEYNLKAIQKMKISKILVREGQTVGLGDQLVELEEEG